MPNNNIQSNAVKIIVNVMIWTVGLGIYTVYILKTKPNATIWGILTDDSWWGWIIVLIISMLQAIVNAKFFKKNNNN